VLNNYNIKSTMSTLINDEILSKLLNTFNDEETDLGTKLFVSVCIAVYFIVNAFGFALMMML